MGGSSGGIFTGNGGNNTLGVGGVGVGNITGGNVTGGNIMGGLEGGSAEVQGLGSALGGRAGGQLLVTGLARAHLGVVAPGESVDWHLSVCAVDVGLQVII